MDSPIGGEYEENEGQQVLRHLKGVVAWRAAAVGLLDGHFRRDVTQLLVVGLVEVTPNEPKPLTDEEVIQKYFPRYPNASPEDRHFISGKPQSGEVHWYHSHRGDTCGASQIFPLWYVFRQS